MIYYKYRTPDEGIKILENLNIWFSNPTQFEDKNDCNVSFLFTNPQINNTQQAKTVIENHKEYYGKNLTEEGIARLSKTPPADLLKNVLKKLQRQDVRVLSLCKSYNNTKMWELYTSNYSGFVIGLNFNKQFSKIFIHDNVNYHTSYEKHLKFSGTFEDYYAVNKKGNEDICKLFTHKHKRFSYEEEYRYIGLTQKLTKLLKTEKIFPKNKQLELYLSLQDNKGFLYPLNIVNIVEIYLGSNINILDKMLILSLIKYNLPHTKIYQMTWQDRKIQFNEISFGDFYD